MLAHNVAGERMEPIRVAAGGRYLHVLLVQKEQRSMEIRARALIDPWRRAAIRSSAGGIGGRAEVARQMNQSLLESDIPIQLGVEIGRIQEHGETIGERV